MKTYKIKVNNKHKFETSGGDGIFVVNGKQQKLDISKIKEGQFHIIADSRSYRAELISTNDDEKKFVVRVNGNDYEVAVSDRYDQLLQKLGMAKGSTVKLKEITAPMPGKVLAINIEEGSEVQKGDPVLVLEAMKMENAIKSPGEGKVKKIRIKQGDAVEKGQVLVEFT